MSYPLIPDIGNLSVNTKGARIIDDDNLTQVNNNNIIYFCLNVIIHISILIG